MKAKELKEKTAHELDTLYTSTLGQLQALRIRASEGQLKKVRDIRQCRKLIARILTIKAQQ